MAKTEPFDKYLNEYEQWFDEHNYVYESELEAVRHFIPKNKNGIEIGIGTGRFALPFGIREGVEPSSAMRQFASGKGLTVHDGIAEDLPLPDNAYDFVLMVTTICFVDDIRKTFCEAYRILKPGGSIIIGLVDKDSPLGKVYSKIKKQDKFYRMAFFYSSDDIIECLHRCNFYSCETVQTVFGDFGNIGSVQPYKAGYGEGGFVVIKAVKG